MKYLNAIMKIIIIIYSLFSIIKLNLFWFTESDWLVVFIGFSFISFVLYFVIDKLRLK